MPSSRGFCWPRGWTHASYFSCIESRFFITIFTWWGADSLEKTLMLETNEGKRRRGDRGWDGYIASLTQWTQIWAYSRRQWRTGKPGVLQFTKNWTQLSDWTTTSSKLFNLVIPQSWCLKRKAFCTQRLLSYLFYISSVYLLFSPCLSLSPSLTFSLSPDIFIYY